MHLFNGFMIGALLLIIGAMLVQTQPADALTRLDAKVSSIDSYFWPPGIALNPHSNKVYIASASSNELAIYDATDFLKIGVIPEDYYPYAVAVNPLTDKIYVSHSCNCEQGKLVTVIDGNTDNVIKRLDGVIHGNIFVDALTNKVFSINATTISVIDGSSDSVLHTQKIGYIDDLSVGIMTVNSLTNKAYGIDQNNTIVSLDLDTYEITPTDIALTAASYANATGNIVRGMVVSPASNLLYIIDEPQYKCEELCSPMGHLVTVNASSGNIVGNVIDVIGGFWKHLTIDPESNVIYVMAGPGFVALNATTNSIIDHYYIPEMAEYYPRAIIVNSETGAVSLVAPNAAVTVPSPETIPEFGSFAIFAGAIGTICALAAIRSGIRRGQHTGK